MEDLRISIVQSQLYWEDPEANLAQFDRKLMPLAGLTDLVVLPEMFTTGFSMNTSLAEGMNGPTLRWFAEKAGQLDAVVTGSFIASEKGHYFNRLIWMRPDGRFQQYDKRHLFTLANEQQYYKAGSSRLLTEWKGWKILPLICYDLRFPVWSRNTADYQLLIYVANWPARRRHAWRSLLTARAIENQAYTIGVNRVGPDGNDVYYSGDSTLIDFAGEQLYHLSQQENILTVRLSHSLLSDFRTRFNFLPDRDRFHIIE